MELLKTELSNVGERLERAQEKIYAANDKGRSEAVIKALQWNIARLEEKEEMILSDIRGVLKQREEMMSPGEEEGFGWVPKVRSTESVISFVGRRHIHSSGDISQVRSFAKDNHVPTAESTIASENFSVTIFSYRRNPNTCGIQDISELELARENSIDDITGSSASNESNRWEEFLETLLHSRPLMEALMAFMERFSSADTISFLNSIRIYKKTHSLSVANEIFSSYFLKDDFPVPKELTSAIYRGIVIGTFDDYLVDIAEEYIKEYLKREALPEFIKSKEFESLLDELNSVAGEFNEPLIFRPIRKRRYKEFVLMMEHGATVTDINELGQSTLHIAADSSANTIANHILSLDEGRQLVHFQDSFGVTPLHLAAKRGNHRLVKKFLAANADPNCVDSVGNTPLHKAAERNSMKTVEILFKAGGRSDIQNLGGDSPLRLARKRTRLYLNEQIVSNLLLKSVSDSHQKLWTDSFSVKVKSFDMEHKKIMNYLTVLNDLLRKDHPYEGLDALVLAIRDTAHYHYEHEEKYMIIYGYPRFRVHRSEHRKFLSRLDGILDRVKGNFEGTTLALHSFVKDWIETHILVSDMMYSDFFEGKDIE